MTSLEIVNNEIESLKRSIYSMEKLANKIDKYDMAYGYIKSSSVTSKYRIKELEQVKEELEKYNKVMKLLKNLFKEIKLEQEDWDGCSIFYMEDLTFDTFEISNELFSILDDLKILVGDIYE